MEPIRILLFIALILFVSFTVYCIKKENFWKSLDAVISLKWGKQVIVDLYLGLFLFGYFIYLNENSFLITLAWLIATLCLGNIVTLLYFIVNYQSLLSHFQ